MSATPDRLNVSKTRIQSPRTPASPSSSTVGASRVSDAALKFLELFKKWQSTVQKGSQYCNAIENVKKGVLDPAGKEPEANPYPANLELYCKNLAILNSILGDVLNSAETTVEQLKVLHVLMKDEVVGRSWNLGKVIEGMQNVCDCMKSELDVKRTIAENIGHSISSTELMLHVSLWDQLSNRNEACYFFLRMLEMEFSAPQS
uniref:Cyclin-dependent kinase 2-interacting protein n=1 Tax=Culex tarsalis TaxID=7177 RepID=A0A1Q3F705_CULTA